MKTACSRPRLALGKLRIGARTSAGGLAVFAAIGAFLVGCASPRLMPREPAPDQQADIREYAADRKGSIQFTEFLESGQITQIAFGDARAPRIELGSVRSNRSPHLLFILDSVPFELVREAWNAGRFRYFHSPARIVSVFPAMTDPAIAEFFGVSPCAGVEAVHFDGRRLVTGYDSYLGETNAPWLKCVNYYLHPSDHVFAYLMPGTTFRRELAEAQAQFAARGRDARDAAERPFVAYSVSTSGLGSVDGRAGHEYALEMLDRYCRQLVFDRRGDVQITLMSDHGHDFTPHHRIDIGAALQKRGYRVGKTIAGPNDVVVPAFGLVSCAAIHTQSAERVARDCLEIPGVELAMFRKADSENEAIVVLARGAAARITCRENRYRYEVLEGDPLALVPLLANASKDPDGRIDERALFAATNGHEFPDPLERIWRAFHGLFVNTPDVYLSLENEAYAGSADLAAWLAMAGVHGNLRSASSCGFVMTTLRRLPSELRMRDVREALLGAAPQSQTPARERLGP